MEARINPPDPVNFGRNVIEFEEMSLSDDCSANTVGALAADSAIASGLGLTYVTRSVSNATSVTGTHTATLGVVQSMQADMLPSSQKLLRLSNENI